MKPIAPVTVVIPLYKSGEKIVSTLESVVAQNHWPTEVIVVDDGTPDDSCCFVEEFRIKNPLFPLRLLHKQNGGQGSARNAGIIAATTKWIAFLDQDDLWQPNKLERCMESLEATNASPVLLYHSMINLYPDSRHEIVSLPQVSKEKTYEALLKGNFISCSSVIASRDALIRSELFDESPEMISVEDYDLWLRLLNIGDSVFLTEPLGTYLCEIGYSVRNQIRQDKAFLKVLFRHARHPFKPLSVTGRINLYLLIVRLGIRTQFRQVLQKIKAHYK